LGLIVHSGGATVDLDAYTCSIEATRSDGTAITSAVATTDNIGTFEVTPTMSNKADKYRCQLVIVDENSKRIASLPFDMEVTKAAMDENAEIIDEDASLYQQYTEAVQGAIAEANADIQAEENARIAAVNAEATARQNADATLQNNINAEATARQTADNTLQGNINSEASTRASADSNLQSQINQIVAPSGEAPSAAEVQNARIGANGETYDTLGNAIRTQVTDLKSAFDNTSISQVSGFYNLIPKLENAQIYRNKFMNGFITSGATPVPQLLDGTGYTTIVVPVASFEENVTLKWEPVSAIPTDYCIVSRYSTTGSSYNLVKNSMIESYSGWDFAYDSTTHVISVSVDDIKNVTTDMLIFCWYDQYPYIFPTSPQPLDSGTLQLKHVIGEEQLTPINKSRVQNVDVFGSMFNILMKCENKTIKQNVRIMGFNTTTKTPIEYSDTGYTTVYIPLTDFEEEKISVLAVLSELANATNFFVFSRYIPNKMIGVISKNQISTLDPSVNWDASYDDDNSLLTINIDIIKHNAGADLDNVMLAFCFYNRAPFIVDNVLFNYDRIISVIPDVVYGVVGRPFSIYYYNIFQMDSMEGYHVYTNANIAVNPRAQNLGSRMRFTCTQAEEFNVTFYLRRNNRENLATRTLTVRIINDTAPDIKAIFLGDSFIDGGKIQAQIAQAMGANIAFYGTRSFSTTDSEGVTRAGNDEGRSGWSLTDYCTQASKNNVSNAFWNGTEFSFSYYIQQNPSFADVTDIFILSGPNDNSSNDANYRTYYQHIVNSIHAYNANIRVHCMMPLTCNCEGYAWGIRNYNGAQEYRYNMINFGNAVIDMFDGSSKCYVIPTHVNFDKIYDFPMTEVNANDRTPIPVEVFNDNVHPNEYGYFCIADMVYADIVANCN
jgi:hypothetical protein